MLTPFHRVHRMTERAVLASHIWLMARVALQGSHRLAQAGRIISAKVTVPGQPPTSTICYPVRARFSIVTDCRDFGESEQGRRLPGTSPDSFEQTFERCCIEKPLRVLGMLPVESQSTYPGSFFSTPGSFKPLVFCSHDSTSLGGVLWLCCCTRDLLR